MAVENSNYTRMTEESVSNAQTNTNQMEIQASAGRKGRREIKKGQLYGLGIAECVLGGLAIILGITANAVAALSDGGYYFYYYDERIFSYTSQGIWGGILLFTTGLLGVKARKKPSVGIFKANLTLSIISSVFACIGVLVSGIASVHRFPSLGIIHVFILVLLLSGMIICIIHSVFCCSGLCGTNTVTDSAVIYVPQQAIPNQQYIQLPNGQQAAIIGNAGKPQLYPVTGGVQPGFLAMPPNQVFQPLSSQDVLNPVSGSSVSQVPGTCGSGAPVIQAKCPSSSQNSGNTEPPEYSTMPK